MYGEPGFDWLDSKTHTMYRMDWIGDFYIDGVRCVCYQAGAEWQDNKKIFTDFLDVLVWPMVKTKNGWMITRYNTAQGWKKHYEKLYGPIASKYMMPIDKFRKKTEGQSKEK